MNKNKFLLIKVSKENHKRIKTAARKARKTITYFAEDCIMPEVEKIEKLESLKN